MKMQPKWFEFQLPKPDHAIRLKSSIAVNVCASRLRKYVTKEKIVQMAKTNRATNAAKMSAKSIMVAAITFALTHRPVSIVNVVRGKHFLIYSPSIKQN